MAKPFGLVPFGNVDNFLTDRQLLSKYSVESHAEVVSPELKTECSIVNSVMDPI